MNKLLDTEMKQAQLRKVDAEIAKLIAESAKINAEARWYPIMIATGLVTAIAAVLAIIGKYL